jgi:hypothetical protein
VSEWESGRVGEWVDQIPLVLLYMESFFSSAVSDMMGVIVILFTITKEENRIDCDCCS